MANIETIAKPSRAAVAEEIIKLAKKHRCGAQVTIVESDSKEVTLRKGEIENLLTSKAVSTGVRIFKENKSTIIAFPAKISRTWKRK